MGRSPRPEDLRPPRLPLGAARDRRRRLRAVPRLLRRRGDRDRRGVPPVRRVLPGPVPGLENRPAEVKQAGQGKDPARGPAVWSCPSRTAQVRPSAVAPVRPVRLCAPTSPIASGRPRSARAMVRPGRQRVDHSSRRVIWAQPPAGPAITHRSGSAAANRVACRSQDAASSGQVTMSSTIRSSPSQRRARAATAAAARAERPRPMTMVRASRRRASSATWFSSAAAAPFPGRAARRTTPAGSRGDAVIPAPCPRYGTPRPGPVRPGRGMPADQYAQASVIRPS